MVFTSCEVSGPKRRGFERATMWKECCIGLGKPEFPMDPTFASYKTRTRYSTFLSLSTFTGGLGE